MDLASPFPIDTARPVNGREITAPKLHERVEAIRAAIQEGPFEDAQRESLSWKFEEQLRKSSHATIKPK